MARHTKMVRNPYANLIKNETNIFGSNRKERKAVGSVKKRDILLRQKAKCYSCRKLISVGVKPHIHHRDGNPSNNSDKNLIMLCPNCHSKAHEYKEVTKRNMWGIEYKTKKLVAKPIRQRKKKRKVSKKKNPKRTPLAFGFMDMSNNFQPPRLQ